MLTRGAAAAGLFILALLAPSSAAIAGPNSDRGDVDFSNNGSLQEGTVSAGAQNPGSPAGGDSGGDQTTQVGTKSPTKRSCTSQGVKVDCASEYGVWSSDIQCWVQRMSPQPPPADPMWDGRTDGAIYWATCPDTTGLATIGGDHAFWAPAAGAAGAPVLVDPVTLAEEAIESANLRAIDIGITPPPGPDSRTLVGIPTWMWVDEPDPRTWGPITLSPSAGPVTVTVTGKVKRVVWDMGDGTTVNCTKGTPYQVAYDADPSPTCGHQYKAPGTYTVTATSDWEFDWAGAGQSGTIEFSLTRDTTVNVAEAFALVTEQG